MRRFELKEGTSSKFWEAKVDGKKLVLAWGRIGTAGQSKTKAFANPAAAQAEHDKLVKEKLGKGYAEIGKGGKPIKAAPAAASTKTAPAAKPSIAKGPSKRDLEQQRARLAKSIAKAGLEPRTKAIDALARWVVRMYTSKASRPLPLGTTRVGGGPDVPPKFAWPMSRGEPMVFAAQVRLEEAAPFDVDGALPKKGLLSFFLDWVPADEVKVFLFTDLSQLERLPVRHIGAIDRKLPDKPCAVKFATELCVPSPSGVHIDALRLDDTEIARYNDHVWMDALPRSKGRFPVTHYLLGHSNANYDESSKRDTECLLRIDTDDAAGLQWGDAQGVHVLIPKKALAKADMKKAWLATDV